MAGNKNKRKGSNLELLVTNRLKEIFPHAKTARQASREMDDCGVDIVNIPFLIQCKSGYSKKILRYEDLFYYTNDKLKERPFISKFPFVLIHKKDGIKGKKQPELLQVTMQFDDWIALIEKVYNNDRIS